MQDAGCIVSVSIAVVVVALNARLGPYEIIALLGAGGMGEVRPPTELDLIRYA
jgi:hypothetical protein